MKVSQQCSEKQALVEDIIRAVLKHDTASTAAQPEPMEAEDKPPSPMVTRRRMSKQANNKTDNNEAKSKKESTSPPAPSVNTIQLSPEAALSKTKQRLTDMLNNNEVHLSTTSSQLDEARSKQEELKATLQELSDKYASKMAEYTAAIKKEANNR